MLRRLLAGHRIQHCSSVDHKQNAHNSKHHSTIVASLGQVKAAGVNHGQRSFRIGAAVVLGHIDILTADGTTIVGSVVVSTLLCSKSGHPAASEPE